MSSDSKTSTYLPENDPQILEESMLTLPQLRRELSAFGVSLATIEVWVTAGINDVALTTVRVKGRLRTSREAYLRWLDRLERIADYERTYGPMRNSVVEPQPEMPPAAFLGSPKLKISNMATVNGPRIRKERMLSLVQLEAEMRPLVSLEELHRWADARRMRPVLGTVRVKRRLYTSREELARWLRRWKRMDRVWKSIFPLVLNLTPQPKP